MRRSTDNTGIGTENYVMDYLRDTFKYLEAKGCDVQPYIYNR